MSYLADELKAVADKNGFLQIDVTRKTGMTVAHVSRIFSGRQSFVTLKHLKQIVGAIAKSREDQARIYRARMLDCVPDEAQELVKVSLRTGGKSERLHLGVSADPEVKRAVEFLYKLVPRI